MAKLPATASGGATSVQSAAPSAAGSPAGRQAQPDEVPILPTRVIKTGSVGLSVRPGRVEIAMSDVTSEADGLGGFVSNSTMSNSTVPNPGPAPVAGSVSSPTGSVTVRVPVASFQTLVSYVENLGTVSSVTTSGQDVTASYVDLQARITALQDARTQFEQILARATAIGDILSVESQISDTETQVEQLQGQLQVLDDQTTDSTLTVSVVQQATSAPVGHGPSRPSGLQKAWDHARHSFVHGIEAVIGALGGIAVFILFAGLALVAGRFGWRAVRRRLT